MKKLLALICCLAAGAMLAAAGSDAPPTTPASSQTKPAKAFPSVETPDLHNAYRLSERLVSGAAPENEQAFKDLAKLGVKTILSVDGARPDADLAKRYGMRYVHLPIGYDGVDPDEGKRIAKALSELPGPLYVHCHHGKHRSAAAVAVACVMNGSLRPEQAESVLRTFGTGENYLGLWKAAREAKPLEVRELAELKVDYVEQAQIPEFAERMVAVDKHWEHLKSIQKNGWNAPKDHPDLDPAHEALQLEEHLRESARGEDAARRAPGFLRLLAESESASADLRKALAAKPPDHPSAELAFNRVANGCTTCHKAHRD